MKRHLTTINRRRFLERSAIGTAALALGPAAAQPAEAKADERPNLIYVFADQLRYLPPHQNSWVNSGSGRAPSW